MLGAVRHPPAGVGGGGRRPQAAGGQGMARRQGDCGQRQRVAGQLAAPLDVARTGRRAAAAPTCAAPGTAGAASPGWPGGCPAQQFREPWPGRSYAAGCSSTRCTGGRADLAMQVLERWQRRWRAVVLQPPVNAFVHKWLLWARGPPTATSAAASRPVFLPFHLVFWVPPPAPSSHPPWPIQHCPQPQHRQHPPTSAPAGACALAPPSRTTLRLLRRALGGHTHRPARSRACHSQCCPWGSGPGALAGHNVPPHAQPAPAVPEGSL